MTTETTKSNYPELLAWIDDKGLTQEDIARLLDVSKGQFSKRMHGQGWTENQAIKLSLLTDLPVTYFLPDANASRILKLIGRHGRTENPDAA